MPRTGHPRLLHFLLTSADALLVVVGDEMLESEPFVSAGATSGETRCFLPLVPEVPGFEFLYVLTRVTVENLPLGGRTTTWCSNPVLPTAVLPGDNLSRLRPCVAVFLPVVLMTLESPRSRKHVHEPGTCRGPGWLLHEGFLSVAARDQKDVSTQAANRRELVRLSFVNFSSLLFCCQV